MILYCSSCLYTVSSSCSGWGMGCGIPGAKSADQKRRSKVPTKSADQKRRSKAPVKSADQKRRPKAPSKSAGLVNFEQLSLFGTGTAASVPCFPGSVPIRTTSGTILFHFSSVYTVYRCCKSFTDNQITVIRHGLITVIRHGLITFFRHGHLRLQLQL